MWVIEHPGRTMAVLLALTAIAVLALGGPVSAPTREDDWLDAMMQAVLVEQAKEGPFWGMFAPYVAQLATVRSHLINGESEAVYEAMNRFMDMLEAREYRISPEVADRLFDYCYLVTPAKYHDVSRHIDKFIEDQYGGSPVEETVLGRGVCHEDYERGSDDRLLHLNRYRTGCAVGRGGGCARCGRDGQGAR